MTTYASEIEIKQLRRQVADLEKQLDRYRSEQTQKQDFLAHVAHELRTPLNTIIGFAQILERHTQLTDEQAEYLTLILTSSDHLLSLIEDILQISKLESGKMSLKEAEFDLFELIEGIASVYRAEVKQKHLDFVVEIAQDLPRYVVGDQSKIRQMLSNLLSNAIKFTETGAINLKFFPEYSIDDENQLQLVFSVTDTGQGIKEEEVSKLFKPYQQTSAGEASNKGTGLGLAITRQLAELMNGYIEVESEWGRGTRFTVALQVGKVYNQSVPVTSELEIVGLQPSNINHRVLIVDDSENNRDLLNDILGKVGFETKVAEDGQCAVEIYRSWQPHLILMDMRMPVLNGYEATKQIRALDHQSKVIILALTANLFDSEADAILLTGCNDYVIKPFRISTLLRKIGGHLGLKPIYNNSSDKALIEQSPSLEAELAAVPSEVLERLFMVASTYSLERVNNMTDELPSNLAQFVQESLDEFDFDAIISLLGTRTA